MELDLELFRQELRVRRQPDIKLSVIDVPPDHTQRTLVFLHGFGGYATQWKYQLTEFSQDNRVIAPDLRGHGQSGKPRGSYRMDEILDDLDIAFDILGVNDPVVLCAHSFGGAVAAEYIAKYPQRVARLVLIATAGEFRLNPLYRLLLRLPYSAMLALAPLTRKWLGAPPGILKAWYEENLRDWNGWSLFRSLTLPTLVIRGHLDIVFERPLYEEVARAIPNAEEVDVGASGHMVMLERREAVNRAIERFLEAGAHSWRRSEPDSQQDLPERLLDERPWLAYYGEDIPLTIAIPRIPLQSLLESAVRRYPGHTALDFEGNRIPYRRLAQEVNRFANMLMGLGIKRGERVIFILPNCPQLVIGFFGTLVAGAVAVFTPTTKNPAELIRQIRDSGASFLVTLTQYDELIGEIHNHLESQEDSPLRHILLTHLEDYLPLVQRLASYVSPQPHKRSQQDNPLAASVHIFNQVFYNYPNEAPEIEVSPQDLAVIQYTGGTTAEPKGVMLSHRNLVANALQTRHWIPEAIEGRERFLCTLPFAHSYGLTAALIVPIALGAALILKPRFDLLDTLKTIRKHRPTIFPGVPQMYVAIKDYPKVRRFRVQSIKACISGSAPLPVEVQEAFEKLTRGRLVEGYGLTEASPITHANPLNGLRKVGSIGIPLPSTEARIVDLRRDQQIVPVGHIGELAVRGPQVMSGYWQKPGDTSKVLVADGWLLTGDVAQMDADGYFRIIARKVDMWYPTKPGKPAFPRDVEEVLFEVPQVKEAVVVAIASQPIAFIIPREDKPNVEALISYCKRRLPPELVPRLVIYVEDYPRTFIGKVLRRELARRYESSHVQAADTPGPESLMQE
ncbi:MAG: alpha/beta fold hydrolase [Anaerolineales bacterium]|jgi:long-chain acyl-CoA synthetase